MKPANGALLSASYVTAKTAMKIVLKRHILKLSQILYELVDSYHPNLSPKYSVDNYASSISCECLLESAFLSRYSSVRLQQCKGVLKIGGVSVPWCTG